VHVGFVLVEKLLVSVDENPWATHGKPADWFGWKYFFYYPALSRILGRFRRHRSAAHPSIDPSASLPPWSPYSLDSWQAALQAGLESPT